LLIFFSTKAFSPINADKTETEMPKTKDENRFEPLIYDNPLLAHGPSAVQPWRLTPPERVNAMVGIDY
jgi:hypothetical protein